MSNHRFDTLYHALEYEAILITADRRYYDKAAQIGRIVLRGQLAP